MALYIIYIGPSSSQLETKAFRATREAGILMLLSWLKGELAIN